MNSAGSSPEVPPVPGELPPAGAAVPGAAAAVALPSAFPASAFEQTMLAMRESLGNARLDARSFERPLTRCDVRDCLGQCCTEGTSLGDEEVHVLRELVVLERDFFESHGITNVENLIQSSGRPGAGGRTLVRDRLIGEVAADYPERFGHAACAFLVDGGRCAFQVLAAERGQSPWRFKPVRCWLHPISLHDGVIAVADNIPADATENARSQVTRCSRTHTNGTPARELLHEEIQWLGAILARDLNAELQAFAQSGINRSQLPAQGADVAG